MGKSPPEGNPSHPPPPHGAWIWRLLHVDKTPNWVKERQIWPPDWGAGLGEGGGGISRFSNNSTTEQYFKMLLSHEGVYSFSSPYCSGKLCSSLFYVPGGGKCRFIWWGRAYKRAPKLVASPQWSALYSTGNISAEDSVYKNKVVHNSTRGIVSPLLFFPLKILLHEVYISNILCRLRLLIQDVYSKE